MPPNFLKIRERYKANSWGINAVIAGTLLRLVLYFLNDSLFRDEARIALNIAGRSFLELLKPLDYFQAAPVPYLWLLRLSYVLGGGSEFSLRLPSLLAGLLSLVLFYLLSLRVLKKSYGMNASVWVFAVAYNLVLYSCLVKQYGLDVLAATAIIYFSYPLLQKTEPRAGDMFRLGLFSAVIIWFSYPAIFIIGGVGLALLLNFRRGYALPVSLFLVVFLPSFLCLYLYGLPKYPDQRVYALWVDSFAPHSLGRWYGAALLEPVDAIMGRIRCLQYVILALCLAGAASLAGRKDKVLFPLLIFPLVLALAASFLRKYPFSDRMLLFSAPGAVLLFGYGVEVLRGRIGNKWTAGLLTACLLLPYSLVSAFSFFKPCGGVKEALAYVKEHKAPGEVVLVDLFAAPTVLYYQNAWSGGEIKDRSLYFEWLDEMTCADSPSPARTVAALPAYRPVWFIAEASGHSRRFGAGFLRGNTIAIKKLLQDERASGQSYFTDRAFALQFLQKKEPDTNRLR